MIVVLLLAGKSKLGAFVELVCVAFTWDVHHHQVFVPVLVLVHWTLFRLEIVATGIHLRNVVLAVLSVCVDRCWANTSHQGLEALGSNCHSHLTLVIYYLA